MGFCKLEQVIPLADGEEWVCCGGALERTARSLPRARSRPRAFVYLSAVLQLTGDFCGKNKARLIPGSYIENDRASLPCIHLRQ